MQSKALFFTLLFSCSLAAADGISPDACVDSPDPIKIDPSPVEVSL